MLKTIQKTRGRQSGPIKRVRAADFSAAEEVLKAATMLIEPDDQTQKQAFYKLMPHLYVLRNNGCSIQQLTGLLTQCGFDLQPSTVRDYFREALEKRLDICQETMNEQIALLAEVRKQTAGSEISDISERVSAAIKQRKSLAASKLDAVFGVTGHVDAPVSTPVPVASKVENEQEAGFSLLNISASTKKMASASPPKSTPTPTPTTDKTTLLRCLPLLDGLSLLKKTANIPAIVYEPGELEHPAIKGLFLSMEQRLSPLHLEYTDESGEIISESSKEKRFRCMWKVPIPMTKSKTDGDFLDMDMSAIKK